MNEPTNRLTFCLYCLERFDSGAEAEQHALNAHEVGDARVIAGSWCDNVIGRADLENFGWRLWLLAHHDVLGVIFEDWMSSAPETNAQALRQLLAAAKRARGTVGEPATAQDADQIGGALAAGAGDA